MRKIAIVTTTRADYGILRPLIKNINDDPTCELYLLVTGTHLSDEFGATYKTIEDDGIPIAYKIVMDVTADDAAGISKAMGKLQLEFSALFNNFKPDILVILGDRYELLPIVSTAALFQIPIAHIHGGEITEGALDESFRHAITKFSHLHFASTESHRKRIIQLGENTTRVFNVGSMAVESILQTNFLSEAELATQLKLNFNKKNILITLHAETLADKDYQLKMVRNLLAELDSLAETTLIFTQNNADTNGKIIDTEIINFVKKYSQKSFYFKTLGSLRYFSLLNFIDAVVGNSSSGIIEVPSFKMATLNIGNRQKGRTTAASIDNVGIERNEIKLGLAKVLSEEFKQISLQVENPYAKENTTNNIVNKLKEISLKDIIIKPFFDI